MRTDKLLTMKVKVDSISFSGCSWHLTYHIGVVNYLQTNHIKCHVALGASSGSLAGIVLTTGIKAQDTLEFCLEMSNNAAKRKLGPVGKMSRYVRGGLNELLPEDAYLSAQGRLKVSITELPLFRNRIYPLEPIQNNQELMQIALGSCYIPIYYEKPIFIKGKPVIDGGATDNLPILDQSTITVSPKPSLQSKKTDIGPKVEPEFRSSMFPDNTVMKDLFLQGYADAKRFFDEKSKKGVKELTLPKPSIHSISHGWLNEHPSTDSTQENKTASNEEKQLGINPIVQGNSANEG